MLEWQLASDLQLLLTMFVIRPYMQNTKLNTISINIEYLEKEK
jgi:hypothetical protein